MFWVRHIAVIIASFVLTGSTALTTQAQQAPGRKEFPPGAVRRVEDLPASRLRTQLEQLPLQARERAAAWLGNFHFTEQDLDSLQADANGGIFYADEFTLEAPAAMAASEPDVAAAAVAVSPFPANLIFHSKPGAPNVIYLNFTGETVTGTAWNNSLNRSSIPAVAFSTDSDLATFSDAEQTAIRRIWQRVAEDYAAFNVDVTTERPSTFTTRTAHALITRNTDANGADNPASTAGGVAYVGVFGTSSYASYRPAWVYANNLGGAESYIAEATSHEIGHNLGLSHDGLTSGSDYYGGHGSGDISWGPLMGTGYNRNVSQWSKGEYYNANNTQDDLATIAGKLSYRSDDHGNTLASATPLAVVGGSTVSSSTPQTDPANASPENKGVIERTGDVDYFSFATGSGSVSLTINPWAVPSGLTKGGNLDLLVELYDANGKFLMNNNASGQTLAVIQTNLIEGVYYLAIRNTGTGAPLSSSPSGYTIYGSIGQYFISGTVVPSGLVIPPGAELQVSDITQPDAGPLQFTVTYSDNAAVDVSTIDSSDLLVTGPNGFTRSATLVSVDLLSDGTPRVATYSVAPAAGVWTQSDNGVYIISMQADAVSDIEGSFIPAGDLGQFTVTVPNSIFSASMDANPGWSFEGLWQYGTPNYGGGGPTAGFTGTKIVAYNLTGNYENRLSVAYATTPLIDCSGAANVTLRFRRWLRLKNNDTASIQVSTDGVNWANVWSSSKPVSDNSWQEVQYSLPSSVAGSPSVRIRWGIGSNQAQNEIGWNIDDVVLLGDGTLDTTAPAASLSVANITTGGSPLHSATVTYSDDLAVAVGTLGFADLLVLGPNSYSNVVEFAGVDITTDGTPRTATYSIPAPDGAWSSAANGEYQVILQDAEVSDTANNPVVETVLGTFSVAISSSMQALVVEPVAFSVQEGSQASFTVRLVEEPTAEVSVSFVKIQGDSDLVLGSELPVVFNASNWSVPVSISVLAQADADRENGSATFECRSAGLTPVLVTVTESDTSPAPNDPPQVAITSPAEGAVALSIESVVITAEATDDIAVNKVEFFANDLLLGADATAPYSYQTTFAPGTHVLTARAADSAGATTTSSSVTITVRLPNQAPVVALTSPADGASFLSTDTISFAATATDDSAVSKVEFFANGMLVDTDTSAPYAVGATLAAGSYTITAKASDAEGLSTTSASVSITVGNPNQAPVVALTSPISGASFLSTDSISFSATASDDSAVAKVEFFANETLIAADSEAPFETSNALPPGDYAITAKATDDDGATTTTTVSIAVKTPTNLAPTVSLASPQTTETLLAPATVLLEATATDDDGAIQKVEFFNGTTSLGADTSAPFALTVADLPAGNYSFTAVATDDNGAATTSTSIGVTILENVRITSIVKSGSYTIKATATPGVPHTLQASSDLINWNNVATLSPDGTEVTFKFSFTESNLFFRISAP